MSINTDLAMQVGHIVDLSNQWLSVEKTTTFRSLIRELIQYSEISGRSLVWLLRPAIHQIYQVRSTTGELLTKQIRIEEWDEGEKKMVLKNTINTDITTIVPDWAKPIQSTAIWQEDALRESLEKSIG